MYSLEAPLVCPLSGGWSARSLGEQTVIITHKKRTFFKFVYSSRVPNFGVDPELAVVTGAAVQAGVIGNSWPLQVAAIELDNKRRKIHVYSTQDS